jgi:hypothetical protein
VDADFWTFGSIDHQPATVGGNAFNNIKYVTITNTAVMGYFFTDLSWTCAF